MLQGLAGRVGGGVNPSEPSVAPARPVGLSIYYTKTVYFEVVKGDFLIVLVYL